MFFNTLFPVSHFADKTVESPASSIYVTNVNCWPGYFVRLDAFFSNGNFSVKTHGLATLLRFRIYQKMIHPTEHKSSKP